MSGRAVSCPGCYTQLVTPSSEMQKREEDVLTSLGFLRKETGARSGWVAEPAIEPPFCSRNRGPKAHRAERSFQRGPGVRDSQYRRRGIPKEGGVLQNPNLPIPAGRGGVKAPSRSNVGPSHSGPPCFGENPTHIHIPTPNPRSQPYSYCAPFLERLRKSKELVSRRNEVYHPLKKIRSICVRRKCHVFNSF